MNINQLNAIRRTSTAFGIIIDSSKKVSAPDTDITAPSPVSTADPKLIAAQNLTSRSTRLFKKSKVLVDNLAHNLRFSIDEDTG
jgi:flagellar protein FlaG